MSVQLTIDRNGNDAISSTGNNGIAVEASDGSQCAIIGTKTNDNAKSGNIGEYVTASLASGSAISLSNNTPANVTSISLTAGDWDAWGAVYFIGTSATSLSGAINTSSAAIPSTPTDALNLVVGLTYSGAPFTTSVNGIRTRISLATTTTVYLVAESQFTGSCSAYGIISARRVR